VEDFTLACGTGTGSVACTLWALGRLPDMTLTAHNPGGTLKVTLEAENRTITGIHLEGPTEITGILQID